MKERVSKREIDAENERVRKREKRAGFKEPTVVKEPSSSLHLDTHKYKAQPFELVRREGDQCSRFPPQLFPSLVLSFILSF